MNRFIYYLLWTLLFISVLYFGSKWYFELKQLAQVEYNPIPHYMFSTLFPIVIGLLLKVPGMWDHRHVTRWGMDWPKLIVIGAPSLYFSVGTLLVLTNIIPTLPLFTFAMTKAFPSIHIISGIILGYVMLDSTRVMK
ncbi:hypothetical protein [Pontibacillus yanchengensis]|uniref:Uncharacterized protein n=1 Tax=Pontibacillus yanchengensis Y32 TaxID=1385514 RepID=A0A0A2THA2_9BACI|nr:hypothetical protein [Pontibacillus yanchengensis]KGP73461.1 hypothetical protein N782_05095 [Pontibacillus yanchengensis Y32]